MSFDSYNSKIWFENKTNNDIVIDSFLKTKKEEFIKEINKEIEKELYEKMKEEEELMNYKINKIKLSNFTEDESNWPEDVKNDNFNTTINVPPKTIMQDKEEESHLMIPQYKQANDFDEIHKYENLLKSSKAEQFSSLEDIYRMINNVINIKSQEMCFLQIQKINGKEIITRITSGIPYFAVVLEEDALIFTSNWLVEKEKKKDKENEIFETNNENIFEKIKPKNNYDYDYKWGKKHNKIKVYNTEIIEYVTDIQSIEIFKWGFRIICSTNSYLFFTNENYKVDSYGNDSNYFNLKSLLDSIDFSDSEIGIHRYKFENYSKKLSYFFDIDFLQGYWIKNLVSVKFQNDFDKFLNDFQEVKTDIGAKNFDNLEI